MLPNDAASAARLASTLRQNAFSVILKGKCVFSGYTVVLQAS